jgi:hypothetical protein
VDNGESVCLLGVSITHNHVVIVVFGLLCISATVPQFFLTMVEANEQKLCLP